LPFRSRKKISEGKSEYRKGFVGNKDRTGSFAWLNGSVGEKVGWRGAECNNWNPQEMVEMGQNRERGDESVTDERWMKAGFGRYGWRSDVECQTSMP